MAYTLDDLVQRVSSKIDETVPKGDNVESGALSEAPVNFIEEELDRSAEFILRMGPVTMVKQAMVKAAKHFPVGMTDPATPAVNPDVRVIYDTDSGIAIVPCPQNFLRFISIELSSWIMPVMELIKQEDPKYRIQKNNRDHRGTQTKPKGALIGFTDYAENEISTDWPNRNVAIECFSSKEVPTLTALHYIPKTKAINLPDDLIDPMLWMCAARTLRIMRQFPAAEAAKGVVEEYFGYKFGFISEEK